MRRLIRYLAVWFWKLVTLQPHFIVGGAADPYMLRWHLLPRNPLISVYVHKFLRDDDDRAPHDHPGDYISFILRGGYHETTETGTKWYGPGSILRRKAEIPHRVCVSKSGKPAWTIVISGPKRRVWGFHCPRLLDTVWIPWYQFLKHGDYSAAGGGCPDVESTGDVPPGPAGQSEGAM